MQYDIERSELQKEFDSLSAQIASTERARAREVNSENILVLQTKYDDLYDQRQRIVDRILKLPQTKGKRTVEYEELMRMLYEIKTDVAIMKRRFEEHLGRCDAESAEFPPQMLTFLVVGGVVTFFLLMFVVIRIGLPG